MDNALVESKVLNIDKSNWKMTKLGDLLDDISQRVDNPGKLGYDRFVGLEHFVSGEIKIRNWGTTENLTSSTKAFKAGDILFARRNAYLRRASLVDFDGCCSGDAFVLREKFDKVVPGFMGFFFNSNSVWNFANENAAGTMSQRVKWRDLANYEFLLPPKDQQAQLAELLWAMDEVIEKEERVRTKFDMLMLSFVSQYFSKNKFPLVSLSQLAEIRYGITLNSKRAKMPYTMPYLRVANVSRGGISLDEIKNIGCSKSEMEAYCLFDQDLLIVEGHADIREIGRAAIWKNNLIKTLHQNHLIRVRCSSQLSPTILESYTNSAIGQAYFQRASKSTSGLNTINSTVVKNFKVPIIPPDLQEEFESKKAALDSAFKNLCKQVDASKALQKSLINQVF